MDDFASEAPAPAPTVRPRTRRWPLGALTLLVVAFVIGGVVLFGGDDTNTTPTIPDLGSLPTVTGDAAPDFSVDLLDGTSFRLSDHLKEDGRPVLLNLWASWCIPCREEMPALDAAAAERTDVYFLGVAVEDDPAAAEAFAEEVGVSYALAIDESERIGRRYPSIGLPATFLISTEGVIVRTVYGQLDEAEILQLITEAFGP